ncbi:nuclear transport factor 2 family protein [Spirulina subsalsa FACHB-351]|uniref:Nuclear transport factor 2 family protein n=1 Tax=Spirulina subsalsa FACHB-351 TaxID=234711 RepID=A0ABT3L2K9_9CYAN|nr:nuclear transport factor 2 family protein [Spirulina subsalsa]MCW6035743.1 nuclear transport factor 2 family protein [Spirulina subsalsa FACHB-351]
MVFSLHSSDTLTIQGVNQAVIGQYFTALNAGDFAATAQLFAQQGELYPPFEEAIAGPSAIQHYLEQEAQGLRCEPQQGETLTRDNDMTLVQVKGRVHTPVFSVNVAWQFLLNPNSEILQVQVKLLASLEELLSLRR